MSGLSVSAVGGGGGGPPSFSPTLVLDGDAVTATMTDDEINADRSDAAARTTAADAAAADVDDADGEVSDLEFEYDHPDEAGDATTSISSSQRARDSPTPPLTPEPNVTTEIEPAAPAPTLAIATPPQPRPPTVTVTPQAHAAAPVAGEKEKEKESVGSLLKGVFGRQKSGGVTAALTTHTVSHEQPADSLITAMPSTSPAASPAAPSTAKPDLKGKLMNFFKSDAEKERDRKAAATAAAARLDIAPVPTSVITPAGKDAVRKSEATSGDSSDRLQDSRRDGLVGELSASPSTSDSPLSLTQRISELTAEKALFRDNLTNILMEKAASEAQSHATIDSLRAANALQQTEVAALTKQLDISGEEVDALKLAIQTLSGQMSNLANMEVRMADEARALKAERDQLIAAARADKELHDAQLAERESTCALLQADIRAGEARLASVSADLLASTAECARLAQVDERCARLVENESNLRHDIGVYKLDLAKLKDTQTRLTQVELENHQLRKAKEKARLELPIAATTSERTPESSPSVAISSSPLELVIPDAAAPGSGSSSPITRQRTPSLPSASSTAAHAILSTEHASLQARFADLTATHTATVAELSQAQAQLEAASSEQTAALAELTAKHAELSKAHEEVVANHNYWRRKCDSLSSSMDKLIKEQQLQATPAPSPASTPTAAGLASSPPPEQTDRARHTAEVRELHATIHSLRTELNEMQATLRAYKKTLENNYALLKFERDANLLLSSKGASTGVTGGLFSRGSKHAALTQQFESVRALANSLSELVADKDLSIAHLKKSNFVLGQRVFVLEKRFVAELEASGDVGAFNGRIDLEAEEEKYQASQAASLANSRQTSRKNSLTGARDEDDSPSSAAASAANNSLPAAANRTAPSSPKS